MGCLGAVAPRAAASRSGHLVRLPPLAWGGKRRPTSDRRREGRACEPCTLPPLPHHRPARCSARQPPSVCVNAPDALPRLSCCSALCARGERAARGPLAAGPAPPQWPAVFSLVPAWVLHAWMSGLFLFSPPRGGLLSSRGLSHGALVCACVAWRRGLAGRGLAAGDAPMIAHISLAARAPPGPRLRAVRPTGVPPGWHCCSGCLAFSSWLSLLVVSFHCRLLSAGYGPALLWRAARATPQVCLRAPAGGGGSACGLGPPLP